MAKKYYWMKLKPTFFNNKEIKKMRRVAGGDTYVIIYLKMQLLSLENEGVIYFDSIEEDFASEIALMLDEDEDNVRVTIGFLERYGLIEQKSGDEFFLTAVPENIGKETESARRMRKLRASQCNATPSLCDTNVQNRDTELEIEKENREDIEIYKDRDDRDRTNGTEEYEKIINLFNSVCLSLMPVKNITDSRIRKIFAIQQQFDNFDFEGLFRRVEKSDFLTGRNGRWNSGGEKRTNFDWILKLDNIAKIKSGIYDNKEDCDNGTNIGNSSEDDEFLRTLGDHI